MKIAIAGFHLESASFLPQECSVADFEANTTRAADIIQSYETTNTVPGGFIKTCQEAGAEIEKQSGTRMTWGVGCIG